MPEAQPLVHGRPALGLTWLLLALSSLVLVEPAPYDALAIALLAILVASGLRIPPGLGGALTLLGLFALANVIAATFSAQPDTTFDYMLVSFYLVLTWLLFTSLVFQDPPRVLEVMWSGYTVAAVIAVGLGIAGYFRLVPGYELFLDAGRARGAFKDANVFGPFLVPVALYLGARLETGLRARRSATFALLLLLVFGILLSFSRGAWGNLAVSTAVYVWLRAATARSRREMGRLLAVSAGLAAGAALLVAWAISTPAVSALFEERAHLFQRYDVAQGGRFDSLQLALAEALQNPVGIGPGQSARAFPTEPHNLYIHVLVETGWLGAVAFCGFLLLSVVRGLRFCLRDPQAPATYAVVVAAVIGTLAGNLLIHGTHWRHLYVLLAMLWGPLLAHAARAPAQAPQATPRSSLSGVRGSSPSRHSRKANTSSGPPC